MKAVFVIDMQEEYVGIGNRYGYDSANLIGQVNQRIQQAKENQDIVIYIKNRKNLKSGIQIPEFAKGLDIISTNIFYKDKASLFSDVELLNFIKEHEISEADFIGIDGNCCVAASAIEGTKLGITSHIPCQYVGVKNAERFSKKKKTLTESGVIVVE